jgi:Zn ribbon nucleic-acid-binding protein
VVKGQFGYFLSIMLKKCPNCHSDDTKKRGKERGIQTYSCNICGRRFRNERREKTDLEKELWNEYVFGKQTVRELSRDYDMDKRVVKERLDKYTAPEKTHAPRKINLIADAFYIGERLEHTSWCPLVFRDHKRKEDLWWDFFNTETTVAYEQGRKALESLGYEIKSITGDGFSGIRQAFFGIPYQMCHVHMERIVTLGTTRKPQLEAGKVLLVLVKTLHQDIDSKKFKIYLTKYLERYREFLNEKTILIDGTSVWTHDGVRSATLSLVKFFPYLFTFERHKDIPKTTNSLEGHFSHVRDIIGVHRGLKRPQMEKVLNTIFLASSIAPTEKKLKYVL